MPEDRFCFGEPRPPHVQGLLLLSSFSGFGRLVVSFGAFGENGENGDDVEVVDVVDDGDHIVERTCGLGCCGSPLGT